MRLIRRFVPVFGMPALALLLLVFDLVAFWAFGRRPLVSSAAPQILLWAVLSASVATGLMRWWLAGERSGRMTAAATLCVMALFSAAHPWHNGRAAEPGEPGAASAPGVVQFEPGVLSRPLAGKL
jgi:hypothetical protein